MVVRVADSPDLSEQPALPESLLRLVSRLANAPAVDPSATALVDQAVTVLRRPGFDTLLSLPQLTFDPFDYQRETAATVLRRMRGRAILADEVGLGKTIEAGLIASELRLRGLAGPQRSCPARTVFPPRRATSRCC